MPLPLLPLAIGAAALLVASRKKTSVTQPASGGTALSPAAPSTPETSSATSQGPGGVLGGIIAAVGAAVAGGIGGKELDKAINPNSNQFSQTAAGVALGTSVGLGALALSGSMGTILTALGLAALVPFVGIIVAVVVGVLVLAYVAIVFIQDLARLGYGQAGARRDFVKQKTDIYNHALEMAQANPTAQNKDMVAVERQLVPFVEGYMARLNWGAYVGAMAKKGVVVSAEPEAADPYRGFPWADKGLGFASADWVASHPLAAGKFPGTDVAVTDELLWHFNWYIDRGYIVGWAQGMRKVDKVPEFNMGWLSDDQAWVLSHCPPEERVEVAGPRTLNYDDNFTAKDTVYHAASASSVPDSENPNYRPPETRGDPGAVVVMTSQEAAAAVAARTTARVVPGGHGSQH